MTMPRMRGGEAQGTASAPGLGRRDAGVIAAGAPVHDTPAPCLFRVRNFPSANDGWLLRRKACSGPEFSLLSVNASIPTPNRRRRPLPVTI